MKNKIYFSEPSCWAPGLCSAQDWKDWLWDKKTIQKTQDLPELEFTTSIFRRRLGQLCRMTVQVVHDCLEKTSCGDIKQVFISRYGDVKRQFTINKTLIEENSVLPAAFSLSVFNAPIALASIACNLKSGYTVMFPSGGNFNYALRTALASVAAQISPADNKIILVYGDELVPQEYGNAVPEENEPLAFATLASLKKDEICKKEILIDFDSNDEYCSPQSFLKELLKET